MTGSKNLPWVLIIIILIAVIFFQRCNDKSTTAVSKRDTVVSIQYVPQPPVTIPQYQPIIIESKQPVNIPQQYQMPADPNEVIKKYQELVNKLIAIHYYSDTIGLKDSSGHYAGTVTLNDVVSENEIKSRNPSYKLSFPVTTKTITITNTLKPKLQLYLGGGINGSTSNYVSGFEAGLILKNKKDQLYGVNAGLSTSGNVSFGISSYWKLKLRK